MTVGTLDVRAATCEAPSKLVQDSLPISAEMQARIVTLYRTRADIDNELRFLRSRLSDRQDWMRRLLVGTDTVLNTLGPR